MPLSPEQQLEEYRVIRPIGQGSFGTVYLAHDTLLARPAAIKELLVNQRAEVAGMKRFMQEARTAGGLSHSNIVTIYALKVIGSNVFLIMEYISGGSLRSLLNEQGQLGVKQAVSIISDVCRGLSAVHAKGIIHRDIKPENILLTEDGRAKVSDFGIAHVPRSMGGAAMTQAGFQPGSLIYMSPEQVLGQVVDARSDVYQIGVVLYEMLAGRHYIDISEIEKKARATSDSNMFRIQAKMFDILSEVVCTKPPIALATLRPDIDPAIGSIVASALAKQPELRPTDSELLALLGGEANTPVKLPARIPTQDRSIAQSYFDQGIRFKTENNWEQAIVQFQQAVNRWREFPEAISELAHAWIEQAEGYESQKLATKAVEAYQNAILIDPFSVVDHYYPRIALEGKVDSNILSAYLLATATKPDSADMHYNLGRILFWVNEEQSVSEYQQALTLKPDNPEVTTALGKSKKSEQAIPVLLKAINMTWPNQSLFDATCWHGSFWVDRGRLWLGDAYLEIIKAYIDLDQFDAAFTTFQTLTSLVSREEDAAAFFIRVAEELEFVGWFQYPGATKRFETAASALQLAVDAYSKILEDKLAKMMVGKFSTACHHLSIILYRLGKQSLESGNREEASQVFERAFSACNTSYTLNPDAKIRETMSVIESARKKARGGWRLW